MQNEIDKRAREAFESWVIEHYGSVQNFKYCCDTGAIEKGFMAGYEAAMKEMLERLKSEVDFQTKMLEQDLEVDHDDHISWDTINVDAEEMSENLWQAALEYSKRQHLNGSVLKRYNEELEAEKLRSQKLVEALEEIRREYKMYAGEIAYQALADYRGKKEGA